MLGRYLAKTALSKLLKKDKAECTIALSENGKPWLAGSNVHLSIAHCKGVVVVALSENQVGIDVEIKERLGRAMADERMLSRLLVENIQTLASKNSLNVDAMSIASLYWTSIEAVVKLEDSSIFSERESFNFLLDAALNYPFIRDTALLNWSVNSDVVAGLAVLNPKLQPVRLQLLQYNEISQKIPVKPVDILAKTSNLNIE